MGFLDALTTDAYPRDSQGRRIFAPYGGRGKVYILPTERADQLVQFQRLSLPLYLVSLLIAGIAWGPWALLVVGLLWIVGFFAQLRFVTRGLEEASERPSLPREERVRRSMQAMGQPTMLAICLAGAASAIAGCWLLLQDQRSVAAWFITLYGALVAALYGRQ